MRLPRRRPPAEPEPVRRTPARAPRVSRVATTGETTRGAPRATPFPTPPAARARPSAEPVIDVREIHKVFATGQIRVRALRGVSLRIERGDYVAIMGTSGSGKSTLMNILGCLDIPTRGDYLLDGIDVKLFSEDELSDVRNRKIGFVFQAFNLVPRTSALANVELPLAYAGLSRHDRRRRAGAALARVGMSERAHHLPSEMSGGQQQRTAVARAIATNPALILADEPTGNLDTRSSKDVLSVFDQINREGRTVVIITHEPEVAEHARRVVRLSDGLIISDERNGRRPTGRAETTPQAGAPAIREPRR